jgi:molybdopterin converting factor small subunit
MTITVKIPTQLRSVTSGDSETSVAGATTVGEVLDGLETSVEDGDEVTILPAVAGG